MPLTLPQKSAVKKIYGIIKSPAFLSSYVIYQIKLTIPSAGRQKIFFSQILMSKETQAA
jgi:hypothetical protein